MNPRITLVSSDKNRDAKNVGQVTDRERLIEAYDESTKQYPPRENYYLLRKVLIAEDGTELQLEEKRGEWVIYPRSVVFINHQGNLQRICIDDTIDDFCLVPGATQFITWRCGKNFGVRISLWDWSTEEQLHTEEFNRSDLHTLGLVDIACSRDFFILYYRTIYDYTFLEVRDLKSFEVLTSREYLTYPFYFSNCVFPSHLPHQAVFRKEQGFEWWHFSRDEIRVAEQVHFPDPIHCIDMVPGSRTLVSGHADCLRFWNMGDESHPPSLIPQRDPSRQNLENIASMLITPDGNHLVSWNDHFVVLWDISDVTHATMLARMDIHKNLLGHGKAVLTDDWKLITPFNQVVEFRALQTASLKYKEGLLATVIDREVTGFPSGVGRLVADFCFFRTTQPARIYMPPLGFESEEIMDSQSDKKEQKPTKQGLKRSRSEMEKDASNLSLSLDDEEEPSSKRLKRSSSP